MDFLISIIAPIKGTPALNLRAKELFSDLDENLICIVNNNEAPSV